MIDAKFFLCEPKSYEGKCYVYPPKVREMITDDHFSFYRKILTISQEEVEDIYVEKKIEGNFPTPFEYLFINAYNSKEVEALTKKAFEFFLHEPVNFVYEEKKIVIGDLAQILKGAQSMKDFRIIEEQDFFGLQNLIRESLGEKTIDPPNPGEHPQVKKMKAKARYRDKIKAKQKDGLGLTAFLASICCMKIGLNPLNIGEISYAAAQLLLRYYQEQEKYETDIRSLLAGASSKKIKPKYWIRNIED